MKNTINAILNIIEDEYEIQGNGYDNLISNVKSPLEANSETLVWISPTRNDKQDLLTQTKSNVIIGDHSLTLPEADLEKKILIRVKNPKLAFIKIVNELFVDKPSYEIHPRATIHPEAKIGHNVHIGAHTYIGKAEISDNTVIYGNVYIYDNVKIGKNVTIEAGCVIGATGYNFAKDYLGRFHKFPHLGGVLIHDDIDIQANTVIDRGVLDDTIIGKGTKIDSNCFIAHNCIIGENNAIIANTVISGSVKTGNNCWFAPATVIRDQITIGNDCLTGLGSVVIKDLEDKAAVMGNPARPISEMKKLLNIFKTYLQNEK